MQILYFGDYMALIKKGEVKASHSDQPIIKTNTEPKVEVLKRPVAKDVVRELTDISMLRDILGHMVAAYVDSASTLDKIRSARQIISFEIAMLSCIGLYNKERQAEFKKMIKATETALMLCRTDNGGWRVAEGKVNLVFDNLLNIASQECLMTITRDMFNVTNFRSDVGRNQGMVPFANPESGM